MNFTKDDDDDYIFSKIKDDDSVLCKMSNYELSCIIRASCSRGDVSMLEKSLRYYDNVEWIELIEYIDNIDVIKVLIDEPYVNSEPLIVEAVKRNNMQLLKILLEHPDCGRCETAFDKACEMANEEALRLFLNHSRLKINEWDHNPFRYSFDIFKLMVDKMTSDTNSLMVSACFCEDDDKFSYVLDKFGPISEQCYVDIITYAVGQHVWDFVENNFWGMYPSADLESSIIEAVERYSISSLKFILTRYTMRRRTMRKVLKNKKLSFDSIQVILAYCDHSFKDMVCLQYKDLMTEFSNDPVGVSKRLRKKIAFDIYDNNFKLGYTHIDDGVQHFVNDNIDKYETYTMGRNGVTEFTFVDEATKRLFFEEFDKYEPFEMMNTTYPMFYTLGRKSLVFDPSESYDPERIYKIFEESDELKITDYTGRVTQLIFKTSSERDAFIEK